MRRNYCEDSGDTRICTLILLEGLEGLRKTNWLWWCRLHFFSPFDHCCSCCIGFEKKAKYSTYIGPIEKSEKECILLPLYFDSSSGTRKRIVHGIQYCVYSFVYAGILSALINNNTASFLGATLIIFIALYSNTVSIIQILITQSTLKTRFWYLHFWLFWWFFIAKIR